MKASVVVTVYNEEKTIERLLNALENQTKKPNEVLIVDGGSSDRTQGKVRDFLKKSRVKIKLIDKKGNRSIGRNEGIRRAKNDIIAITDAGGYPKKDWFEKIIAPLNKKGVKIVSGYYTPLAKTSFQKAICPYFLVMPDRISADTEFLPSSRSVALRKEVWKKVGGYPEEYSHNEDLVFDLMVKEAEYEIFFEPEAIVYWYPPESLVSSFYKFFRFSLGDAESGIKRPKIKYIFARYLLGLLLFFFQFYSLLAILVLLYLIWAIFKNKRYVSGLQTVFWFPIIQVTADLAVMLGFLIGTLKRK